MTTVAPTLDVAGAGARLWDVLVIGAGPSGALAARELARRGLAVLLVDRATCPRWKVCGACLGGAARAALAAVGLGDLTERLGAVPLAGMSLLAWGYAARVPLTGWVAVSRAAFDAGLVAAAVAGGASFLPSTWAWLHGATPEARRVRLRRDSSDVEARARVVVVAGGLGATGCTDDVRTVVAPAARLGAGAVLARTPAWCAPGTVYMACATGGYVGMVVTEDGGLNIAAALDAPAVRGHGNVGRLVAATLAEAGTPAIAGLEDLPWRGTPPLTRRVVRPAARRLFLVGDAAGYVEPFTGEGIGWALASGGAVAAVAGRAARRWDDRFAAEWSAHRRHLIGRRQIPCRALAAVLRHPALARAVAAILAGAPRLCAPLLRSIACR